jgi:hypothetical protein
MDIVLLVVITIILFLYLLYLLMQVRYSLDSTKAPFVSTSLRAIALPLTQVITSFVPRPKQVEFFELGAGRAKLSRLVAKNFGFAKVTAIEYDGFLAWLAKMETTLMGSLVIVEQGDILDRTYPQGSVLYCYLMPELLVKMYDKGLFEGQLVLATTFGIRDIKPTTKVEFGGFQKRLFVYDFR